MRGWGSSNSDDWKENLALSLICDNEKNHLPKIPNENNSLWHSKVNDVEKVAYCYKQVSTLQQKMAKLGNCAVLVTFMCLD